MATELFVRTTWEVSLLERSASSHNIFEREREREIPPNRISRVSQLYTYPLNFVSLSSSRPLIPVVLKKLSDEKNAAWV